MFKLRLDAQDRQRLDALAEHYSAPAATVLRILIKKEFDSMRGVEAGLEARAAGMREIGAVERRTRTRRPLISMSEAPVTHGAHSVAEPHRPRRKDALKKPGPRSR